MNIYEINERKNTTRKHDIAKQIYTYKWHDEVLKQEKYKFTWRYFNKAMQNNVHNAFLNWGLDTFISENHWYERVELPESFEFLYSPKQWKINIFNFLTNILDFGIFCEDWILEFL